MHLSFTSLRRTMKQSSSEFARYVKNQTTMSSSRKRTMRRELTQFYSSLYGEEQKLNSMQSIFMYLFQWKMTVAKLVIYCIATLTVSTWVYASVAPESFAETSASVKKWLIAVVDTTLEVVGIKATSNSNIDVTIDGETQAENNDTIEIETERKLLLNNIFWGDSDTEGNAEAEWTVNSNTSIKTDTSINTNVQADVKAWVDANAVIDEAEVVVDSVIDTAGDINANINAIIKSDTTTTTKTNNAEANTNTSIQGQVEWTINTQGTTNTIKEEKNAVVDTAKDINTTVEASSNTSSTTTAQGIADSDSIEWTINSVTESENVVWLGL